MLAIFFLIPSLLNTIKRSNNADLDNDFITGIIAALIFTNFRYFSLSKERYQSYLCLKIFLND